MSAGVITKVDVAAVPVVRVAAEPVIGGRVAARAVHFVGQKTG